MSVHKSNTGKSWVFNIDKEDQGIHRKLTEGITTRIFCGDQVMLSVVRIEPHTTGTVHSHPEEQWGLLLEGECVRIQGDEERDEGGRLLAHPVGRASRHKNRRCRRNRLGRF